MWGATKRRGNKKPQVPLESGYFGDRGGQERTEIPKERRHTHTGEDEDRAEGQRDRQTEIDKDRETDAEREQGYRGATIPLREKWRETCRQEDRPLPPTYGGRNTHRSAEKARDLHRYERRQTM